MVLQIGEFFAPIFNQLGLIYLKSNKRLLIYFYDLPTTAIPPRGFYLEISSKIFDHS